MDPTESVGSRGSTGEEEPLIPDEIDEEFYEDLVIKINDLARYTRVKLDNAINADNIQRIQMVCAKYKTDLYQEEIKVQELIEELERVKNELENSLKISQLDKDTNEELKGIIQSAWKQKDTAQSREQEAQEELYKLREKVEHMEVMMQRMGDRKHRTDDYERARDNFNKERDKLQNEIKEMNKKLQISRQYANEVEVMVHTLEDKNKALIQMLDDNSTEAFKDKKKIEILNKQLAEVKLEDEKMEERMKKMKAQTDRYLKHHVQQNLQLLASKTNLDQLRTLHNATNNKLCKTLNDCEYLNQTKEKLKMDLIQKTNMFKAKENENRKLKIENKKYYKIADGVTRRLTAAKRSKNKVEDEVKRLVVQTFTIEKELLGEKKTVETNDKKICSLTLERDSLRRELIASQTASRKFEDKFMLSQQDIRRLQENIRDFELNSKKLLDELDKAKQETEKRDEEINGLDDKIDCLETEILLRDNIIDELKKNNSDIQAEMVKLQGLLDMTRNEKNLLQRNLQQVTTERDKLRTDLQTSKAQIEDLKETILKKNIEINKLQIQIERLEKERTLLKTEIKNTQVLYQHSRSELLEKRQENDKLYKVIQDDDKKLSKTKKYLDSVLHEKNLTCTNLNKVSDDVTALRDRLELTQNALDQCEKSYGEALEHIRLMKIEIKNLQTEKEVLRKDREFAADLRTELLQIHRVLNQERIKARALEDEVTQPMNVHRWRSLSGTDPDKMELIFKIQTLQKQVLAQNISVLERENALEESHKLYTALKQFMMKLPSYKIKEQLNEVKNNLGAKNKIIKALMAELATKEVDEKSKDLTLDELRSNLTSAKKELTLEKKKKNKLLEEQQIFAQMQLQCFSAPSTGVRMLGAGYKMTYGSPLL